jgi:hypothetical protein
MHSLWDLVSLRLHCHLRVLLYTHTKPTNAFYPISCLSFVSLWASVSSHILLALFVIRVLSCSPASVVLRPK